MFLRDTSEIRNNLALADSSGKTMTYGELDQLSEEYLKWVPERSLVFILCDYHIDTVAFYYSMMNNHVVPLLLDKKLDKELLENLIQVYQPQYIWMEKKRMPEFSGFAGVREYEEHILLRTQYEGYELYPELALLLTTSGSTGSPKLVRISYQGLIFNMNSMLRLLGIRETDRGITVLPMTYCYGLSHLHMHWLAGGSIFLNEWPVIHGKFWESVEKFGITNFQGVPYTYEMLERSGFLDKQYPSLRFLTQAGAKLPEELQRLFGDKLSEKGIALFILYGQTEATTYLTGYHSEKDTEKLGSIGKPIFGMHASLSDEKDGIGELVFHSESVALGYAEKPEDLRKGDESGQKLHTGDLACIDEDGYIFIKGRMNRIIKMLGVRFNLDEIETLLTVNFRSAAFACVGEDNALNIYYEGELVEEEAKKFCRDKIGLYAQMIRFIKLKELPHNESGKIYYARLSQYHD